MPTQAYFGKYPPLPTDLPVAKLPRVSFENLLEKGNNESDVLFELSRSLGFFLLDFEGSAEGRNFLKNAERMFDIGEVVNALDQDELAKYAYNPPTSLFGYKQSGSARLEDGRPDRIEFYNVGRDDIFGISDPLPNPACIEAHRSAIKTYMKQADSIIALICSHLEKQLHLAPGTLTSFHSANKPSGTHLRMLRGQPQLAGDQRTSFPGHTDIGSITILFNVTSGLQLLTPDADPRDESSWTWVKPQPGCAIINLGDAMVEWSAGILRSNMHRVTFAPGEQGKVTRYSLAYLARPDGNSPMKRLSQGNSLIPELGDGEDDNLMNAREWEAHRAAALTTGHDNVRSRGGRPLGLSSNEKLPVPVECLIEAGTVRTSFRSKL